MSGRNVARKRRSVPMEFPASGTRPRLADVLLQEGRASGRRPRRGSGWRPRWRPAGPSGCACCAPRRPSAASSSGEAWTTRSGPSCDDGEVVVGDQGGDLDDGVARRIEPGHLEIDPGQHVAGMLVPGPGRTARWRAWSGPSGDGPPCLLVRSGDAARPVAPARPGSPGPGLRARGRRRRRSPGPLRGRAGRCRRARARAHGGGGGHPAGYAGFVLPRSGLAPRHGITCLNTPGLIDSGYRGELQVRPRQPSTRPHDYEVQPRGSDRAARHPAGGAGGLRARGGRRAGHVRARAPAASGTRVVDPLRRSRVPGDGAVPTAKNSVMRPWSEWMRHSCRSRRRPPRCTSAWPWCSTHPRGGARSSRRRRATHRSAGSSSSASIWCAVPPAGGAGALRSAPSGLGGGPGLRARRPSQPGEPAVARAARRSSTRTWLR